MEGCGAAGSRTLVQTSSNRAFYTLSLFLIVGNRQATNSQPEAYLLCFRRKPEACLRLVFNCFTPNSDRKKTYPSAGCLVRDTLCRDWALVY